MTPIEKNVIVVDEQGNEYEATYPKRAKGLVKCGRARFVDENKICLACPPNKYLEDEKMSEINNNTQEVTEQAVSLEAEQAELSVGYILKLIEKIAEDNAHIHEALCQLKGVKTGDCAGDVGAQGKAQAIATVVKCRETTNQQLIKLYEKMYDDVKPKDMELVKQKVDIAKSSFDHVLAHASELHMAPEDLFATVGDVTEKISELVCQIINK